MRGAIVCDLIRLMEQCEQDTRTMLGAGAANRLGNWRRYAESQSDLVSYIKKLLRGEHRENGWELNKRKGLSLERIVIDRCPELFEASDHKEAKETLGLPE